MREQIAEYKTRYTDRPNARLVIELLAREETWIVSWSVLSEGWEDGYGERSLHDEPSARQFARELKRIVADKIVARADLNRGTLDDAANRIQNRLLV